MHSNVFLIPEIFFESVTNVVFKTTNSSSFKENNVNIYAVEDHQSKNNTVFFKLFFYLSQNFAHSFLLSYDLHNSHVKEQKQKSTKTNLPYLNF